MLPPAPFPSKSTRGVVKHGRGHTDGMVEAGLARGGPNHVGGMGDLPQHGHAFSRMRPVVRPAAVEIGGLFRSRRSSGDCFGVHELCVCV